MSSPETKAKNSRLDWQNFFGAFLGGSAGIYAFAYLAPSLLWLAIACAAGVITGFYHLEIYHSACGRTKKILSRLSFPLHFASSTKIKPSRKISRKIVRLMIARSVAIGTVVAIEFVLLFCTTSYLLPTPSITMASALALSMLFLAASLSVGMLFSVSWLSSGGHFMLGENDKKFTTLWARINTAQHMSEVYQKRGWLRAFPFYAGKFLFLQLMCAVWLIIISIALVVGAALAVLSAFFSGLIIIAFCATFAIYFTISRSEHVTCLLVTAIVTVTTALTLCGYFTSPGVITIIALANGLSCGAVTVVIRRLILAIKSKTTLLPAWNFSNTSSSLDRTVILKLDRLAPSAFKPIRSLAGKTMICDLSY